MSRHEQVIVTIRAGEPLPGTFVRLIATEDVQAGTGANTERVYTVLVLLAARGDETR